MMFALFLFLIFKSKSTALLETSRGSMGEDRAAGDNIISNYQDCIDFCIDDNLKC